MIDEFHNPFDFGRPVKDPRLFAGRNNELNEVNYYLELAKSSTPVYYNLSLIGLRAAGKTSMLNIIKDMAEKKGFLAIKITLNNDLAGNEVALFKEIFDGIMTVGVGRGMFGGISGKVYRLFRQAIDTLDVQIELPFLFGTAYIGMKKNEGSKTPPTLSQHVVEHDLSAFSAEAKKHGMPAIVLLLDECDLLSENLSLLQKLRNIFSEIEGYVLIFSGTEKMFPAMTETFSPIPRMFKRINVENFDDIAETKDCILSRLSAKERKLVNDFLVKEIHTITSGSPYEVQLVSHFMYELQRKSASWSKN